MLRISSAYGLPLDEVLGKGTAEDHLDRGRGAVLPYETSHDDVPYVGGAHERGPREQLMIFVGRGCRRWWRDGLVILGLSATFADFLAWDGCGARRVDRRLRWDTCARVLLALRTALAIATGCRSFRRWARRRLVVRQCALLR
ncbi:hypothetical protein GCM10010404_65840 [Nonomuraea africana]